MTAPGSSLLHYRLLEKIGAGGMGEVWKATDTTLGREVAIKILPASFASDADRLARFQREAKVLATLNHAGIAGIFGLHEAPSIPSTGSGQAGSGPSVHFLAMELAPGDELAERVKGGALPLAEALDIARQIAEALEVAHEHGIVHRDLKPANVKITPDGKVKVLDFGLAKALAFATTSGPERDSVVSPTITSLGTVAGVILGTAAYMSPEQARGKPVDKRADIWAFGCVLYEMLTGKRPFEGETISDTLAAVLAREPDFTALPPTVPGRVRDLLRRCLEKDSKRRLRDIGDARIELEEEARGGPLTAAQLPSPAGSLFRATPLHFILLLVAAGAVSLAAWALTRPARVAAHAPLARLEVTRPAGSERAGPGAFAIAPDGSAIVLVIATPTGTQRLLIRDLDRVVGREIPGTDDASFPFWSADSRHIAFFAERKLKRVPRSGGAVQTLCDAPAGRGGAWGPSGIILFAPTPGSPLSKVDANGGVPEPATTFGAESMVNSHRFPSFLPDGRHFLYAALPEVQPNLMQVSVASLDDPRGRPLLLSGLAARYVEPGYVLFTRDQAVLAQRIDPETWTMAGDVLPLAEPAEVRMTISGTPPVDGARNGTLVYDRTDDRPTDVVWVGRDGRSIKTALRHSGQWSNSDLSGGGDKLAAVESKSGDSVLWVADIVRGTETRLSPSTGRVVSPVWMPNDRTIVALSAGVSSVRVVVFDADSGAERFDLMTNVPWTAPTSVAPDGTIILDQQATGGLYDIVYLPRGERGDTRPYLATPANETEGSVSPDGRFLAYSSDASGRPELYVDGFPEHRGAVRVSTDGASGVLGWREDGRELYFAAGNGTSLMACDVHTTPTLEIGTPHLLFDFPADTRGVKPAPHGEKFLVLMPVGAPPSSLVVVQNWASQLDTRE